MLYYIKEVLMRPKAAIPMITRKGPFLKGIIFMLVISLVISFSLLPSVALIQEKGNIIHRNPVFGIYLTLVILVSTVLLSFWVLISFAFFNRARRKDSGITFRQVSSCVSFAHVPFIFSPILGFTYFRVMKFCMNREMLPGIIEITTTAIWGLFHFVITILMIIWWLILLLQARRVSLLFTKNLSK